MSPLKFVLSMMQKMQPALLSHAIANKMPRKYRPYIDVAMLGLLYLEQLDDYANKSDPNPEDALMTPPIMLWEQHGNLEKKIAVLKLLRLDNPPKKE